MRLLFASLLTAAAALISFSGCAGTYAYTDEPAGVYPGYYYSYYNDPLYYHGYRYHHWDRPIVRFDREHHDRDDHHAFRGHEHERFHGEFHARD